MEQRNSKLLIGRAGGTVSASAKTYKISLTNSWVEKLAVTEEDRELTLSFDGEKIIIEKNLQQEIIFLWSSGLLVICSTNWKFIELTIDN